MMKQWSVRKQRPGVGLAGGILCALLLLAVRPGPAAAQQSGADALAELQEAFARGDVRGLLAHAADRVDITIFGASAIYSRAQAQYVMEDFFRQQPPERFNWQDPSQRDGNWFAAGLYWYRRADHPLRIYVRLRQTADQWELREIRIDRRMRE